MWSVREALQKFIERLELEPEEQKAVADQHTEVREALRQRLGSTDFLSGSYSRSTAIRPLHDIDLFIVLGSVVSPPSTPPDTVLKQVRQALYDKWPNKELPILQRHSVHLEFPEKGIEFDVVPAFEQSGQQAYFIPERQNERQNERWLHTNPRLHQERSTEANEQAGKKLKPLLKAVKHWNRRQSSSPLGSFHLEVMSYSAFPQPPQEGYLECLKALFSHLSRQVMLPCPDPARLGGPNVDERMSPTQREAARQLLESAARTLQLVLAEEKASPAQAHARMRELLGEEYRDRGP
jgi:hypothetical protein